MHLILKNFDRFFLYLLLVVVVDPASSVDVDVDTIRRLIAAVQKDAGPGIAIDFRTGLSIDPRRGKLHLPICLNHYDKNHLSKELKVASTLLTYWKPNVGPNVTHTIYTQ